MQLNVRDVCKNQYLRLEVAVIGQAETEPGNGTTMIAASLNMVRWLRLLPATVLLLCLSGCFNNKIVTYVPHENNNVTVAQPDPKEATAEALRQYYSDWRGTRYLLGGLSHDGVDCSGFAQLAYRDLFGKNLPRTVRQQAEEGVKIPRAALQPGDLVFFKTGLRQRHVGIYLEDDLFIHVSPSKGVTISNLNNRYWHERFWQAQRL
jgi:probable lipoprotein NlpC